MVSEEHKEGEKFAKFWFSRNYVWLDNCKRQFPISDFMAIKPPLLTKTIQDISGDVEGSEPDIVMISHSNIKLNPSIDLLQIPGRIVILWIEVVKSNFQIFPKKEDAIEAIKKTLTWNELYDPILMREGSYGKKLKTSELLYLHFNRNNTEFYLKFYIVKKERIWECNLIS